MNVQLSGTMAPHKVNPMQQSTIVRPSNQTLAPSYRAKVSQWPFRVVSQREAFGGDVMINARRIVATTTLHFLKSATALSAPKKM